MTEFIKRGGGEAPGKPKATEVVLMPFVPSPIK